MRGLVRIATVCGVVAMGLSQHSAARQAASPTYSSEDGLVPQVTFKDGTDAAGIDFVHTSGASPQKFLVETMGSGAVFFDYDNDGRLDIFLVDGGSLADPSRAGRASHRLYRNRGDRTFEDRSAASGIKHREYGMGACAGDYDNDGWVDLYITNLGPNALYKNKGEGRFTDVSREAGVTTPLWSTSCAFFDFDHDGDLDLFVANYVDAGPDKNPPCGNMRQQNIRAYCHPLVFNPNPSVLYRNDGNGRFTDVSAQAGIAAYRSNGLGVVVSDFDNDGWPDVFVANDGLPNYLFHNKGDGRFEEIGLLAGVALAPDGRARAGMGTDAGDYDGDGRFDLIVTNLWGETHSLFRGLGAGLFDYATAESTIGPSTLPFVGFGTAFVDYDNDTRLDIAVVNGDVIDNTPLVRPGSTQAQRRLLFRSVGRRRFTEVGRSLGVAFGVPRVGRGLAVGDIDNDGDVDLLASNNGSRPDLLINDGGNAKQALIVRTIGTKSNRDGVGTRLALTVGPQTLVREIRAGSAYLSQSDSRAHFGLGSATRAQRLELRWPSGQVDVLQNVDAGQILTVREGAGIVARQPFIRTN